MTVFFLADDTCIYLLADDTFIYFLADDTCVYLLAYDTFIYLLHYLTDGKMTHYIILYYIIISSNQEWSIFLLESTTNEWSQLHIHLSMHGIMGSIHSLHSLEKQNIYK